MFSADASGLRKLGAQLRKSQPAVYRRVRRAVLEQAKVIADDARQRAAWSSRIPGSVRASTSGGLSAVVRAGGASAPHAAAFEHAGRQGSFRHPVFANQDEERTQWSWVSQEARPFLHPAALDRLDETVRALGVAVIEAVDEQIRRA